MAEGVTVEGTGTDGDRIEVRIHAPAADRVWIDVDGNRRDLRRADGSTWIGALDVGTRYNVGADGPATERFDPARTLVDPRATEVWFPPGHRRDLARPGRHAGPGESPTAVAQRWPTRRPQRHTTRPLVVYEAHVRGLTRRRNRADGGTFAAAIDELDRLADLGVSVLELMPVQQFDPDEGNYWGYMPLVFGAVHRSYAAGDCAPLELAELIAAAHDCDIEVWLDVVFNHTTEADADGPTYNLRGLADDDYYLLGDDGTYLDDAGTGNAIDATSEPAQILVMEALDRYADLGVDGFRFDLAAVLARDEQFVRRIGDWSIERGVRLIAEPWDLRRYLLGRAFPDPRWMQWNDRFRDDMRGFLRGDPGLVSSVMRRIEGSPDLFDAPMRSVNFLTAHDGFTMYDLVAYDGKHNEANGWDNTDGTDENRSWNCGHEGDVDVPAPVTELRRRQMLNAMCLLMLSHGVPQFVAGDEFARTQRGNNNPYNQDNEVSWIDWARRDEFIEHEAFVARLVALRARFPVLADEADWWGERVQWFGVDGGADTTHESRSLAWQVDGLYVMANMWWEALTFRVQAAGEWSVVIDTSSADGVVDNPRPDTSHVTGVGTGIGSEVAVGPRSVVVLVSRIEAEAQSVE